MATFSNKGKGLRSGALWPAMRKCLTEHLGKDNNCTKDSGLLRGMEDYGIIGGDYTAHFSSSSSLSPVFFSLFLTCLCMHTKTCTEYTDTYL